MRPASRTCHSCEREGHPGHTIPPGSGDGAAEDVSPGIDDIFTTVDHTVTPWGWRSSIDASATAEPAGC